MEEQLARCDWIAAGGHSSVGLFASSSSRALGKVILIGIC